MIPIVKFLKKCGIVAQYTMSTVKRNGVADRRTYTLKDIVKVF